MSLISIEDHNEIVAKLKAENERLNTDIKRAESFYPDLRDELVETQKELAREKEWYQHSERNLSERNKQIAELTKALKTVEKTIGSVSVQSAHTDALSMAEFIREVLNKQRGGK